jgi:hypothetical protein
MPPATATSILSSAISCAAFGPASGRWYISRYQREGCSRTHHSKGRQPCRQTYRSGPHWRKDHQRPTMRSSGGASPLPPTSLRAAARWARSCVRNRGAARRSGRLRLGLKPLRRLSASALAPVSPYMAVVGPELVMLYNDAWRPILSKTKHPTWVRSIETGHPFVTEPRQRQRLVLPDADNDAMIGPGVVGQIPDRIKHRARRHHGGRSSDNSNLRIAR